MAHNYILQVTAGPSYDLSTHRVVPVNQAQPLKIQSEHTDVLLNVRVKDYRGLPPSSPSNSPYFELTPTSPPTYSIAFKFTPPHEINGNDLLFGNDFDHPIRDRLPPGFSTAFRIVKWVVDPGLEGDVYADKPHMFGPLLSSVNALHVGAHPEDEDEIVVEEEVSDGSASTSGTSTPQEGEHAYVSPDAGIVVLEGGKRGGRALREEKNVPESAAARKKHFLTEARRREWVFGPGREVWGDFFNGFLDFNEFALRLPGFTLPIMKYWDGQPLRYVLKHRSSGAIYLVVCFTLYLKEDVDEHGNVVEGAGEKLRELALRNEIETGDGEDAGEGKKVNGNGMGIWKGEGTNEDDVD